MKRYFRTRNQAIDLLEKMVKNYEKDADRSQFGEGSFYAFRFALDILKEEAHV